MMPADVQSAMVTAFAVYDPRTGKALAVFASADLAGLFLHHVQASGAYSGVLRVDPWDVPGEIFECEE